MCCCVCCCVYHIRIRSTNSELSTLRDCDPAKQWQVAGFFLTEVDPSVGGRTAGLIPWCSFCGARRVQTAGSAVAFKSLRDLGVTIVACLSQTD